MSDDLLLAFYAGNPNVHLGLFEGSTSPQPSTGGA